MSIFRCSPGALLTAAAVLAGAGPAQAQFNRDALIFKPDGYPLYSAELAPFNGYPRNYYRYAQTPYLPTYLTSINYPRVYGAYTLGIAPGAYTYGASPSVYSTSPGLNAALYPLSSPKPEQPLGPVLRSLAQTTDALTVAPAESTALLTVQLPADADLRMEGRLMPQTGAVRRFVTPRLTPGMTYTYDLRATWYDGDRRVSQRKEVEVRAGERAEVVFTAPPERRRGATLRTEPLPLPQ